MKNRLPGPVPVIRMTRPPCDCAKPVPASIDVADLLEQMRPNLERRLRPAGIFTIDVCRQVPRLCGDGIALEAAISSLLLYARKELRAVHDVQVSVVTRAKCGNDTEILIQAALSPPEALRPYRGWPVSVMLSRRDEIGLATARLFAESISGRVSLDRSVDGSLTITLRLPSPAESRAPSQQVHSVRSVAVGDI